MKKLLFLVSVSIVFFSSCIPNPEENPDPYVPPVTVLLQKTVDTYDNGDIVTTNFTYNGTKIVSIVDDMPDEWDAYYTYTGDLITKLEWKDSDGVVQQYSTFEYDDTSRLVTYKRIEPLDDLGSKETYIYNIDGTVSVTYFSGDATTQTDAAGTGTVTFAAGEISSIHTVNGSQEFTQNYTYDNKNNPFMNVTGWSKIAFVEAVGEGVRHNVVSIMTTETGVPTSTFNYTFTYASDFPATGRTDDADGNYDTDFYYQ